MYNPAAGPPGQHFQPGAMVYGTSPGGYSMMARQLSNNPQFQGQPQMMPVQGYMHANGMPAQVMYAGGQPAFFAQQPHMAPQPGHNGYPSPAARPAMMVPQGSQSGHNTPMMGTPYFQPGAPVAQMRYGGPHHQQFAGQPQQFPQHPGMQRGPSGNFQPQIMPGGPQGMMPAAQAPQDGGNE